MFLIQIFLLPKSQKDFFIDERHADGGENNTYILHRLARIPSVYNMYMRVDMYGDFCLPCVCLCLSTHTLN